jgi:hypothetical protein
LTIPFLLIIWMLKEPISIKIWKIWKILRPHASPLWRFQWWDFFTYPKVAILLDSSREFRVSTSDLNHFAREETVLAGFRF